MHHLVSDVHLTATNRLECDACKLILAFSCLDDNELLALGVDWIDYANIASELGIDVLRYADGVHSYPLSSRR